MFLNEWMIYSQEMDDYKRTANQSLKNHKFVLNKIVLTF